MMFTRTTTTGMDMNESMDSKYTVADILSSMASGEALTPTVSRPTKVPSQYFYGYLYICIFSGDLQGTLSFLFCHLYLR